MRETATTLFKSVIHDRSMIAMFVTLTAVAVVAVVYFSLHIHPSELQVNTHYTAYGNENFYRSQWQYVLSFVGFIVVVWGMHSLVAMKLYQLKGAKVALLFGWLSVGVLLLALLLIQRVINIAALS